MMRNLLKRYPSRLALAVLLFAFPALSSAEPADESPWYQFEVIIFERIAAGAGGTEYWPQDPGTPSELNTIPLLDRRALSQEQAHEAQAYQLLPDSERQLSEHFMRLRNSRNYRPLLHLAWRQPMAEPTQAQPLYLDFTSRKGEKVSGTLKVGLKRYLHLETDLLLQRPVSAGARSGGVASFGPGMQVYRTQANRRMRSEELHYLDHPVLGLLVLAKRFELPEPAKPAPEETPEVTPAPDVTATPTETATPDTTSAAGK
jgi:hypothetical protein